MKQIQNDVLKNISGGNCDIDVDVYVPGAPVAPVQTGNHIDIDL